VSPKEWPANLFLLEVWFATVLDLLQVVAQAIENLLVVPSAIINFTLQFVESEVDNVVVVQLLRAQCVAEFEPDAVQEVDFFWRQSG